jgi:hypothetical protein
MIKTSTNLNWNFILEREDMNKGNDERIDSFRFVDDEFYHIVWKRGANLYTRDVHSGSFFLAANVKMHVSEQKFNVGKC